MAHDRGPEAKMCRWSYAPPDERGAPALCMIRLLLRNANAPELLDRPDQARLHVEERGGEAGGVGDQLTHHRERGRMRRLNLSDNGAEIEVQLGIELLRELLHAVVVGQACHVQELEAAVARRQQRAAKQRCADAMALPRLLDAEGRLGLAVESRAERPQFASPAQHVVDEEAVDHGIEIVGDGNVIADELIRYAAAEPASPGVRVEAQQMLAVDVGL